MAIKLSNPAMLKAIFDGWYNGGESTHNKWSFQKLILEAPKLALQAKIIPGWRDAAGKEYSTSIADHMVYMAKSDQRVESELAAIKGLLTQIAQAANKGVAVDIDYDKIAAMMPKAPEYKLTPVEEAK